MRNEASLRRLVLVKRLYLEGIEKAESRHNYADHMIAVVNLFLAVETLMGAVVLETDQQPDQAIGTKGYTAGQPKSELVRGFKIGDYHKFEQLFDQVVAILRSDGKLGENDRLFKWGSLKSLHKARNDAQHGAKAPNPADLPALASIAKEFIERILELYFESHEISLAGASLAELIEDNVLRLFMKSAEAALAQAQRETSALLVRVAFLLGRLKRRYDWWKDRGGHRIIDDYDVSRRLGRDWGTRSLDDRDTRLLYNIMTQASKLPEIFDNWMLGLEKVDRDRLAELTPRLVHYPEGTMGFPPSDEVVVLNFLENMISGEQDWSGPYLQKVPSQDECLWTIDYTEETLLRWQREERGRFTAVDPNYLNALPILEQCSHWVV